MLCLPFHNRIPETCMCNVLNLQHVLQDKIGALYVILNYLCSAIVSQLQG
jgi:hypothetical protein